VGRNVNIADAGPPYTPTCRLPSQIPDDGANRKVIGPGGRFQRNGGEEPVRFRSDLLSMEKCISPTGERMGIVWHIPGYHVKAVSGGAQAT